MNFFFKSISYLLHPLLMPVLGSVIYFSTAPRFIPNTIITTKLFGLSVLTIFIPIALFFFFKNLGFFTTIHSENIKQRKIPLLFQAILLLLVIKVVIDVYNYPELYFFFLGVLFSTLSTIFIVFFNIKASLHMIGIGGVTMFTIALSIHFGINLTLLIAAIMIANGLIATSRLHLENHGNTELFLGFLIGIIPQLSLLSFWL